MDTEPATPGQPKPHDNGYMSDSGSSTPFLESVPGEIALFRAVTRARPIGLHRHFHMMSVLLQIFRETGQMANGDEIWEKLREMYDLDTLNDLEELAEDDYNGYSGSPSPSEDLSNHPHFKKEYSLYDLPHELDIDLILTQRRKRGTPSLASPTPEFAPPPKLPPIPTPTGPKKRGRKRKYPLPPPPPLPKAEEKARTSTPRQSVIPGSDSEISALTENSEIDVDISIKVDSESKLPQLRASVIASTPGSMGEEVDILDVASPAASNVSTRLPPVKRGRKPKGGGQVVPQDPGHVPRKRGRPPKNRPPVVA